MTSLIGKQVAKGAQQIAQQTAKQLGEEPFEIAKTVGQQVVGLENKSAKTETATQLPSQASANVNVDVKALEEKDKAVSQSMYNSLQNQIRAITRQKNEEERAKKMAEDQQLAASGRSETVVEPSTKRSRNPLKGMAKKLADLGKRAEIRMPPSG